MFESSAVNNSYMEHYFGMNGLLDSVEQRIYPVFGQIRGLLFSDSQETNGDVMTKSTGSSSHHHHRIGSRKGDHMMSSFSAKTTPPPRMTQSCYGALPTATSPASTVQQYLKRFVAMGTSPSSLSPASTPSPSSKPYMTSRISLSSDGSSYAGANGSSSNQQLHVTTSGPTTNLRSNGDINRTSPGDPNRNSWPVPGAGSKQVQGRGIRQVGTVTMNNN